MSAARSLDIVDEGRLLDDRPDRPGEVHEPPGSDLEPARVRHDVLELMGLVDHHHVVLGQHGTVAVEIETEQVGVDHDHVGVGRPVPRLLGEARTALRAALARRDTPATRR